MSPKTQDLEFAREVEVKVDASGRRLQYAYRIDSSFEGTITIEFPVDFAPLVEPVIQATSLAVVVFLGQLTLAEQLKLEYPCDPGLLELIRPIAQLLYNVRSYRDEVVLRGVPHIETAPSVPLPKLRVAPANPRRACVLWAGGKDSTLAIRLLQENGYEAIPIHVPANVESIAYEELAVRRLSDLLGVVPLHFDFQFPRLVEIGRHYSRTFGQFPTYNAIPHGRDLLLPVIGLLACVHLGARFICVGHEYDLWSKQIMYRGSVIYRHDMQSEYANMRLSRYISFVAPDVQLFSPVAALTEYRILQTLFTTYPELARNLCSCFWGTWCGECSKCLRYSLVQRLGGYNHISFIKDPLRDSNPLLRATVESLDDSRIPFIEEIQHCLTQLVESTSRNECLGWEATWQTVRNRWLSELAGRREAVLDYLVRTHEVELTPEAFTYDSMPTIKRSK